jgi:hypothetical protein
MEPKLSRRNILVVRVVAAWLAALLAVGLWQGYGAWLFGIGASHGG